MVLGEIVAGIEAINKLLDAPLKARTAFRLGKLSKELSPHFETYEKVRQELLESLAKKLSQTMRMGRFNTALLMVQQKSSKRNSLLCLRKR